MDLDGGVLLKAAEETLAIRLASDATLPVVSNRASHQENDMITTGLRRAGTMP